MPRGWIFRFKKSHDLHICTRPTCNCCGILGDGIRKKKSDPMWQTSKYSFLGGGEI